MIINDKRALAYTTHISWIKPIEGADNIELVGVLGWVCIAKIGEFKVGDLCVYFEIDSKLPEVEWSAFMESKKYRVKTMKLNKFKVISQGLAMPISAFNGIEIPNEENVDVTELLGVTYYEVEDNKRKAASVDKYRKMYDRNAKLFKKNRLIKWLYKRMWGKKLLFIFFGSKNDKASEWPAWVHKTDEERCQNLPFLFPGDETKYMVTEKIDGTSTTFTMKRGRRKNEFYVCSRNVVFNAPDKACFYDSTDGNVYLEMANKYHAEDICKKFLIDEPEIKTITLQGETFGGTIQKRNYGKEHRLRIFNVELGHNNGEIQKLNPLEVEDFCEKYGFESVPVLATNFTLPETCEELLKIADGKSVIDGGMREGIVLRTYDCSRSFKAVSNEFLLKYHS